MFYIQTVKPLRRFAERSVKDAAGCELSSLAKGSLQEHNKVMVKVAISMDAAVLRRLDRLVKTRPFRSRSQAVQEAVSEKINRLDKSALAKECAKLDRKSEQAMADEELATEIGEWPKY
jgi:Arc/MetJ-type ribon-helix-helix transcriptional regulator